MTKVLRCRVMERPSSKVGRATQTTADFIAVSCLFFGVAFAALAPIALQERFVVFSFATVLAIGFYMSGCILHHILNLSGSLGEIIIRAFCNRLLTPLADEILGYRIQNLENQLLEQSLRLEQSQLELKHLRGEMEIALNAEADLRSALIEMDGRANAATQNIEAEKAKLQAALDRANGERARLAYELSVMKRQAGSIQPDRVTPRRVSSSLQARA